MKNLLRTNKGKFRKRSFVGRAKLFGRNLGLFTLVGASLIYPVYAQVNAEPVQEPTFINPVPTDFEWYAKVQPHLLQGKRVTVIENENGTKSYVIYDPSGDKSTMELKKEAEDSRSAAEKLVDRKADEYGVSRQLLHAIVRCESGYRSDAKNPNSTATGYGQWLESSWMGYVNKRGLDWTVDDRLDGEKNLDMTAYVISIGGLRNWTADPRSVDCWGVETWVEGGTQK